MDPTKLIGRVKEVVRMEHKSRSNYPHVWNDIAASTTNKFYHQDEIELQLKEKLKIEEPDSNIITAEAPTNPLEICRCGRPKRNTHLGKCLQRALNPTLYQDQNNEETESKYSVNMPQTSNSLIGWRNAPYLKIEQSMQYISPKSSMPGPRITTAPYNVIFIG